MAQANVTVFSYKEDAGQLFFISEDRRGKRLNTPLKCGLDIKKTHSS